MSTHADDGWKRILIDVGRTVGDHLAGAEDGVLFYGYDTLAYPDKEVDLVARLRLLEGLIDIPGVTLGFYLDDKLLGKAVTDDDGRATVSWRPPRQGDYSLRVKVLEKPRNQEKDFTALTPARLFVAARPKDTLLAIVDLDHTVVQSGFARVLLGGAQPMPHSQDVLKRLSTNHTIIYLTHRPNLLSNKSKNWLIDNGFVRGPLLMSELADAFGDSGKFKTARLKALRETFPNVQLGIGDKLSDAAAYATNGVTAYLIPHYDDKPKSMRNMATELAVLRRSVDKEEHLNVVGGWKEIERGIFEDKRYPAETYIKSLRSRAERRSTDRGWFWEAWDDDDEEEEDDDD
ncbi:MAG: hypothetical protein ACOCXX_00550 [Planctomycetota bacterium]